MRGEVAAQILILDALKQTGTGCPILRMIRKVVDQRISVKEDLRASGDGIEGHGDSRIPNSGSRARRSKVSGSPFQGIIPAVCWATLTAVCTVTITFSWSFHGNG